MNARSAGVSLVRRAIAATISAPSGDVVWMFVDGTRFRGEAGATPYKRT